MYQPTEKDLTIALALIRGLPQCFLDIRGAQASMVGNDGECGSAERVVEQIDLMKYRVKTIEQLLEEGYDSVPEFEKNPLMLEDKETLLNVS